MPGIVGSVRSRTTRTVTPAIRSSTTGAASLLAASAWTSPAESIRANCEAMVVGDAAAPSGPPAIGVIRPAAEAEPNPKDNMAAKDAPRFRRPRRPIDMLATFFEGFRPLEVRRTVRRS